MNDAARPRKPRVAIDGPAGAGKSTIGERLAALLGCPYLDTGAFYRTLTSVALARGLAPDDGEALAQLARTLHIEIAPPAPADVADGRQYTVLVDGQDVTPTLRTPAVEANVSRMSGHEAVRAALRELQRGVAERSGVVMVGRDIGTVVLPDADLKIYLTTSLPERAERRHGDLVARLGAAAPSLEDVRRDLARRDEIDGPHMTPAPDAVAINNDALQADDVVARIRGLLEARGLLAASESVPAAQAAPNESQRVDRER